MGRVSPWCSRRAENGRTAIIAGLQGGDELEECPKVYVITLNWNAAADTTACGEALRALDYSNCCFVVCDNASRRESVTALRAWGHTLPGGLPEFNAGPEADWPREKPQDPGRAVLIHTGGNLGYAGGMNAGMRYALDQGDADYVWILNNDTVMEPDALSRLVDRMQEDLRIGICGSTLIDFNDRQKIQELGGASYEPWRARSRALGAFGAVGTVPKNPAETERHMGYISGAAMLVSRAFLAAVGLMDERYFLYSEEHDWAQRGRRRGFRLGYAPRSIVYHKHGATIGTSPHGGSELSLFYLYRSKRDFAARHYPWLLPVSFPALCWDGLKFLMKGQKRKARAVFRGLLAAPPRKPH